MNSLWILYSALAVFGVGVTIVDMIGVFEHAGGHDDGTSGHGGGHDDSDATGGHDAQDDGGVGHDSSDGNGYHDVGHDAHGAGDHNHGGEHGVSVHHGGHVGSYVASVDAKTRAVAKAIGLLRSGVYFSLGAGLTGVFSLITGVAPVPGLLWSAGAGLFIAALARGIRALVRRDLDSSFKPEEFIMDKATVLVGIAPGALGKIAVRRYGAETELYARAKDPSLAIRKGASVRIVDWDSDCHWVEPIE